MKFILKKKRLEINLDKKNFLAKGGEGEVYSKGNVVYKICDPGKMIPEQKFKELAILDEPHIICPEDILVNTKGKDVGYTMKLVPDAHTLCQLFTKAFRTRNNVTPDMVLKLIRQMQSTIQFIHSKKVLLVDLNELNFLIDTPLENVFFIDVNSYQTPSYPATAIMESIRDRHCKNNNFSEGTDWFSFAIVSFQMFIGIHPYKGMHPQFNDKHTAMNSRMLANISVLNPKVSYPKAVCQPLSVIPDIYLQWYKAVLDQGVRIPPPNDMFAKIAIVTTIKAIKGSNNFDIEELYELGEEIIGYRYSQGTEVIVCDGCVYINKHRVVVNQVQICFLGATPFGVWSDHGTLHIQNLMTGKQIPITCNAEKIFTSGDRVYVMLNGNVLELTFTTLGSKVLAGMIIVGTYLVQSTKVFEGVLIQTLFDATIVSIFPNSKETRQVIVKELNGLQIVDAKYNNRLLGIITVDRNGTYARHMLRFGTDWSYEIRTISDVSVPSLNFVGLPNGIGVLINEQENVEIFKVDNPAVKEIDDPVTEGDMILASRDTQVMFFQGKKLYSIKIRK